MIVAIIPSRLNSSRFPNKALAPINGKTMITRVIERVKMSGIIDKVVVATTMSFYDTKLCDIASMCEVEFYRGSENNVLDRFYRAASFHKADIVVRVTGDCPLVDPAVIDRMLTNFLKADVDYLCNTNDDLIRSPNFYPDGLDVEIMTFYALSRAWKEATDPGDLEHVTKYIVNHPDRFKIANYLYYQQLPKYHWSVDVFKDLEFVESVYQKLGDDFTFEQVLEFVKEVK